MFFTIPPALVFYLQLESLYILYQSKLHTLRNPKMYTAPKFESEKAARSLVERLQNGQRRLLGLQTCSDGWQKYVSRGINMNRCYNKHGRYHWSRPEYRSKQLVQQPIKRIASGCNVLGW